MEVEVSHFVDAGERDMNGRYDYYYEGETYTFVSNTERLVVRMYVDEPNRGFAVGLTVGRINELRLASEVWEYLRQKGVTLLGIGPAGTYEVWEGRD